MVYGYRLNPDVSEIRTVGMLKEVEDELNRKRKTTSQETTMVSACVIECFGLIERILGKTF